MKSIGKVQINKVIDSVAFFCFILLASSGILLKYILIPGSGHFTTIWGMDRHEWGTVHFWISAIFFFILSWHLFVHWKWIVFAIRGKATEASGKRLTLGLVGLLAIILLAIAPIVTDVEVDESQRTGGRNEKVITNSESVHLNSGEAKANDQLPELYGYMTIAEVAEMSGLKVGEIKKIIKVGEEVSAEEKIGRLVRLNGMTMEEVRTEIELLKAK